MSEFSHIDKDGNAQMVDVGAKAVTQRTATASGKIFMAPATIELIKRGGHKKGDVLGVARISAIQAAKQCALLIPLCHTLALTAINVDFTLANDHVLIDVSCSVADRTGVEMESLTAVSVAGLTIYDMCKAADRGMTISDIKLFEKKGGKSGHWQATK